MSYKAIFCHLSFRNAGRKCHLTALPMKMQVFYQIYPFKLPHQERDIFLKYPDADHAKYGCC